MRSGEKYIPANGSYGSGFQKVIVYAHTPYLLRVPAMSSSVCSPYQDLVESKNYAVPDYAVLVICVVKSRRIRRASHAAHMRENEKMHTEIWWGNPKEII